MTEPMTTIKRRFPTAAQIQRALEAFIRSGLSVGAVEVSEAGDLRIESAAQATEVTESDFDRLERSGSL